MIVRVFLLQNENDRLLKKKTMMKKTLYPQPKEGSQFDRMIQTATYHHLAISQQERRKAVLHKNQKPQAGTHDSRKLRGIVLRRKRAWRFCVANAWARRILNSHLQNPSP